MASTIPDLADVPGRWRGIAVAAVIAVIAVSTIGGACPESCSPGNLPADASGPPPDGGTSQPGELCDENGTLDLAGLEPVGEEGESAEVLVLTTQPDVERLRGCVHILGRLEIGSEAISDLSPLADLQTVSDSLTLGWQDAPLSSVTTLAPLANLRTIGGSLRIIGTQCTSLVGLERLESVTTTGVGDLVIALNPSLTTLDGLESLRVVGGGVNISGNALLRSVASLSRLPEQEVEKLYVTGNPRLETLEGLGWVTGLRGSLFLSGNTLLANLAPLVSLNAVGRNVLIEDNDGLVSIEGLVNLASLGGMILKRNNSLTRLAGPPGVSAVTYLEIEENSSLESLEWGSLVFIERELNVLFNQSLPQSVAEGFAATIQAGRKRIAGNLGDEVPKDPCPWADDGVCDEAPNGPPLCGEGTDGDDCILTTD